MSSESSPAASLWSSDDTSRWHRELDRYEEVVEGQGVEGLPELDGWVHGELPQRIAERKPRHITLEDMVGVTRWKMARGVWRARNLALVRSNDAAAVVDASTAALAATPDPKVPIRALAELKGVGPATASAVAAAAHPEVYPFFDDLVAAQVPGLGRVAFTLGYYLKYAEAIRERARRLGDGWTPASVERALWAHAGGKAGLRAG